MKGITKPSVIEVKAMPAPPAHVKANVLATLLLLGHFEEETKMYKHARANLKTSGPDALQTRTQMLNLQDVPLNVALGAQLWTKDINIEAIQKVSKAAADFYRWNQEVIDEVLSRHSEEEISKTEPRTKLYTDPEPEQAGVLLT